MPASHASPLRVGAWRVDPLLGEIARDDCSLRMDARGMRLLVHLAAHAGEVVSIDDLLEHVWAGVIVTPDSVYQAVTSLRRALGDDAKNPAYIATVPRLGYRMIATVEPWHDAGTGDALPVPGRQAGGLRRLGAMAAVILLILGMAGAWAWRALPPKHDRQVATTPLSIAVLPFLDLTTQAMDEEYFADGLTEETINRLSVLPGAQIPGATASFYYKDKSVPVTDIAHALGTAYVLDGSVRKSDGTIRIAARLLRASDGHVVWTQSYDRPAGDVLTIQKDVAGEIVRSLQKALAPAPAVRNDTH